MRLLWPAIMRNPGDRGASFSRYARAACPCQTSSCRIGTSAPDSVADADGQVRGVDSLYVTDASAFRTASGVNPMLSIMAVARRTATRMAAR